MPWLTGYFNFQALVFTIVVKVRGQYTRLSIISIFKE